MKKIFRNTKFNQKNHLEEINLPEANRSEEAGTSESNTFLEHDSFIINNIETGSAKLFGDGAFKDVFCNRGFVYLKEPIESYQKPVEFYKNQKKVRMLKNEFGISIADLVYHKYTPNKTRPKSLNYYEVQERLPGHGVEMFQPHQFIRYMKEKYSKTFESEASLTSFYVPKEIAIEMQNENLIALKERVLCGQKFLPKAFRDHVILSGLNILDDVNGENILFDPEKGYSFIDLTMSQFPSGVETPEDVEKHLQTLCSSRSEFIERNNRIPKYNELKTIRPNIYNSFFQAMLQPNSTASSQGIEPILYKSILFSQVKNMVLDYAKRVNFDDMQLIEKSINAYSRKYFSEDTLHSLAKALTNNGKDPDVAKSITNTCWNNHYEISVDNNTDFNTRLDAKTFLSAMQTLTNPELDYNFKKSDDLSLGKSAENING